MEEKKLVKMLIIDKLSKKEIARKLNLTEVAVRKKFQKLKDKNILLGNKPIVNFKKINLIYSITGIDVEPNKLIDVIENLKTYEKITSIYLTSGDHTILMEIVCEDLEELKNLHKIISQIDGVKKVCPCIVNEIIKC